MKPNANWKIDPLAVDETIESIRSNLASPISRVVDDLRKMLLSGLSISDNMNAAIVTLSCKHGVESPLSNPLKGKPLFFLPFYAAIATGSTSGGTEYRIDGTPVLRIRPDGLVGITVYYNLKHTIPSASLGKTSTQSIGNSGTGTAVTWDSNSFSSDGIISVTSSSRITFSEAGRYSLMGNLNYAGNATGIRSVFFAANGATPFSGTDGSMKGYAQIINAGVGSMSVIGCAEFDIAAGGYVQMYGFQTSGAGLNIDAYSQCQISRVRNDSTPTCTVTGVLFGG